MAFDFSFPRKSLDPTKTIGAAAAKKKRDSDGQKSVLALKKRKARAALLSKMSDAEYQQERERLNLEIEERCAELGLGPSANTRSRWDEPYQPEAELE